MAKKIGKINMRATATNVLVVGATSAVAQIAQGAILPDNPETMDYILLGAGLVLPSVVKAPEASVIGNTLMGIGIYRMAERYDLASKIGIGADTTTTATTAGWQDTKMVGKPWTPRPTGAKKETASAGSNQQVM